jgi:CspA family cold shock protein
VVADGTVVVWHDEDGWGVVECAETPGGCFIHFSAVAVPGVRALAVGQAVHLEHERADQDGYRFRAVRAWPRGVEPHDPAVDEGPSSAYRSTLTVTWDDEPDG